MRSDGTPNTVQRRDKFATRGLILSMDTRNVKDRAERKRLKRAQRKKQPPKPKQTDPRGSHKKKVKKAVRGQTRR